MQTEAFIALLFVCGMFAGVSVIFMAMRQRSQQLEMLHRERMAMIERGQNPVPAATEAPAWRHGVSPSSSRSMSLGIVVVALGLALMTIISLAAGAPETGLGVGGAIAIVGASFIINSLVSRQGAAPPSSSPPRDQFPEQ